MLALTLGFAVRAQGPSIIGLVRVDGEDPAIRHLLGKGFQAPDGLITLLQDGSPVRGLLVNDAHILFLQPPPSEPPATTLTLVVGARVCRFPLGPHSVTLSRDGTNPLGGQAIGAWTPELQQALRVAWGIAEGIEAPAQPLALDGSLPGPAGPAAAADQGVPAQQEDEMVLAPNARLLSINGGPPITLPTLAVRFLTFLAAEPGQFASGRTLAHALFGESTKLNRVAGIAKK
jgi:hypothetical protein